MTERDSIETDEENEKKLVDPTCHRHTGSMERIRSFFRGKGNSPFFVSAPNINYFHPVIDSFNFPLASYLRRCE
jgi:hypothetical protein